MPATAPTLENLSLNIVYEIHVRASIEATFDALLEQIGPANERAEDHAPMPMVIEPRPGGRWFRDLGDDNGHCWGHVQAIKRPTLLEISGPLFMSAPVANNIQYRLKSVEGGTLLTFRHTAFGPTADEHREGLKRGWQPLLERIRQQAENGRAAQ